MPKQIILVEISSYTSAVEILHNPCVLEKQENDVAQGLLKGEKSAYGFLSGLFLSLQKKYMLVVLLKQFLSSVKCMKYRAVVSTVAPSRESWGVFFFYVYIKINIYQYIDLYFLNQ